MMLGLWIVHVMMVATCRRPFQTSSGVEPWSNVETLALAGWSSMFFGGHTHVPCWEHGNVLKKERPCPCTLLCPTKPPLSVNTKRKKVTSIFFFLQDDLNTAESSSFVLYSGHLYLILRFSSTKSVGDSVWTLKKLTFGLSLFTAPEVRIRGASHPSRATVY